MKNHIKDLIQIIKTGTPGEVKDAQRRVEKFWHDFYIPRREEGRKAFEVFLEEVGKIKEIKDIDHQAYFINTLKWPLWAIGEEYFEVWADFILKGIQHPSGKIRQAILRAADYLIMDIRVDLRFDFNKKDINQEDREVVEKNIIRFGCFVQVAENLLEKYYEPRFRRHKYIDSMPPSVYKSLQQLITKHLLRSEYYENIYQEFIQEARIKDQIFKNRELAVCDNETDINMGYGHILWKRNEIEVNVSELLKEVGSGLSFNDIKNAIYNEKDKGDLMKIINVFGRGENIDELNKIMSIISEAWNYFPHKSLDGLSPTEKLMEYNRKQKEG